MLTSDARDDWYLFRLNVDSSANAGDGSGDMQVRNLSDGEVLFRTVLTEINLGLTSINASFQNPGSWDLLYIRGTGCSCGTRGGGDDDWAAIQEIVVDATCTVCDDFLPDILEALCIAALDTSSFAALATDVQATIGQIVTGSICASGPSGGGEAACEAYLESIVLDDLACDIFRALLTQ